ncbi:hypothetical protein [Weissella sp. MSCH1]|uniref:hypothetical protein n=1 Tax=Weissella sp. MSCH1 TaxID=3383343 RepID=UPI003896955E
MNYVSIFLKNLIHFFQSEPAVCVSILALIVSLGSAIMVYRKNSRERFLFLLNSDVKILLQKDAPSNFKRIKRNEEGIISGFDKLLSDLERIQSQTYAYNILYTRKYADIDTALTSSIDKLTVIGNDGKKYTEQEFNDITDELRSNLAKILKFFF